MLIVLPVIMGRILILGLAHLIVVLQIITMIVVTIQLVQPVMRILDGL